MLKLYLPNSSNSQFGGGWSFRNNLQKGLQDKAIIVDKWQDSDIILIIGATMTERQEMYDAKKAGKKIIFRLDNMPKDSANRGTALSRMRDFAKISDWFICQSLWALNYVGWYFANILGVSGLPKVGLKGFEVDEYNEVIVPNDNDDRYQKTNATVIYNGVDTEIFNYRDNPDKRLEIYLYTRSSRNENKRFPEAAYLFYEEYKKAYIENRKIKLVIVGHFSSENLKYNFDFFAGEDVYYWGTMDNDKQMADVYRKCKYMIYPHYLEACPNTIPEALACGVQILGINPNGGSLEIFNIHKDKPYTIKQMADRYLALFQSIYAKN